MALSHKPSYRVAHIGAFDLASYGDQLYPLVAAAELGRRVDDIEVLPFGPVGVVGHTRAAGHPTAATWALGHWSEQRAARLANQSTLVLCGGGEIVNGDGTLYSPFYGIDQRDAASLRIDRWFIEGLGPAEPTCPTVWHAPGVPVALDAETARRVRKALAHRALVAVRDDDSRDRLEAAGVEREIEVVPDSALLMTRLLTHESLDAVRDRLRATSVLPRAGSMIVVQGNDTMTPLAKELAKALDALVPDPQIVTVSVSPCHGDERFAAELGSHTARSAWHLPTTATVEEVAATIAGADCFLGVSLHGAITALAYGRPSVAYDPFRQAKLAGFLRLAGLPDRRTHDPVEAAKLVARFIADTPPTPRLDALHHTLDGYFDRIAALVVQHGRPLRPIGWNDSAAAMHLSLRQLPREVAPVPVALPDALRRPGTEPTLDELTDAIERSLAARRVHSLHDPDYYTDRQVLQGTIDHLEDVVTQARLTEADLRADLASCAGTRHQLEDALRLARASRIFRLTGRPRALGLVD